MSIALQRYVFLPDGRKNDPFLRFSHPNSRYFLIFAPEKYYQEKKGQRQMCTVSIDIDEAAIRDLRPELDTNAAIRLWVQDLINLYTRQMKIEDEETMDIETAREMTLKAVREEYALP